MKLDQGCTNRCSLAAGLRGNEERMRKWRGNGEEMEREWGNGGRMRKSTENEEMERGWGNQQRMRKSEGEWGNGQRMKKWREISSLSNNFLFLLWNYFTTTLKYVTFCRKNLCIRSTRYGYEPKRLTFLRCVPNPHFNGACQSWNDFLVPTSSSWQIMCKFKRRRTNLALLMKNNKETSKEEEQTWLC